MLIIFLSWTRSSEYDLWDYNKTLIFILITWNDVKCFYYSTIISLGAPFMKFLWIFAVWVAQ